jgi:hypothetical protein
MGLLSLHFFIEVIVVKYGISIPIIRDYGKPKHQNPNVSWIKEKISEGNELENFGMGEIMKYILGVFCVLISITNAEAQSAFNAIKQRLHQAVLCTVSKSNASTVVKGISIEEAEEKGNKIYVSGSVEYELHATINTKGRGEYDAVFGKILDAVALRRISPVFEERDTATMFLGVFGGKSSADTWDTKHVSAPDSCLD